MKHPNKIYIPIEQDLNPWKWENIPEHELHTEYIKVEFATNACKGAVKLLKACLEAVLKILDSME